LPGLREFVTLLFALSRVPEVRTFPLRSRLFPDLESMQRAARRPLWVLEGSPEDGRLAGAVRESAVALDGGYALNAAPRTVGVVTWKPAT
jgi:hypothetical protein